ncbi:AraC family transcriptional regulator [Noviherbaspirillum sp.]|uniref:AraC family transcriptional regulator n=1 Tax=Noviherbaspirillum sp. TaxID=1926288 RepID=UPI002FDF1392
MTQNPPRLPGLGSASLYLWHGRALVVGPGIDSTPHAHFAAQITVALERPFRVRLDAGSPWVSTHAAIFAPNQMHQLDCGGAMLAHLFIDSPQCRHAISSVCDAGYRQAPGFSGVMAALDEARQGRLDIDAAERAARQWLDCAAPQAAESSTLDPRISAALAWIGNRPGETVTGGSLAAQTHLSESRFTHLFRQQTGLPLSRYLLWSRLLRAVEAVADGEDLTAAAHAAGFADLAHMSRTFRGTFGVVPSELRKMTIAFKRDVR